MVSDILAGDGKISNLFYSVGVGEEGIVEGGFEGFYVSLISPGFNERSSETAMGERTCSAPVFHVNEPKKTGARSAAKTH